MPVIRQYTDTLATDLTPDELRERGRQLADLVQEIDGAEAEEGQRRKDVKKILDDLTEKRTALAFIVHRGQEDRETKIQELADYKRGTFSVVRLDTGEVIRERPLKPEERQGTIAEVLQATAAQVNAGLLDKDGMTVRAEVRK